MAWRGAAWQGRAWRGRGRAPSGLAARTRRTQEHLVHAVHHGGARGERCVVSRPATPRPAQCPCIAPLDATTGRTDKSLVWSVPVSAFRRSLREESIPGPTQGATPAMFISWYTSRQNFGNSRVVCNVVCILTLTSVSNFSFWRAGGHIWVTSK